MLDGESFSQGAKCVLADSDGKYKFPDFYINTRRKKGNVLSISAIDRTVYLGQMFDYTSVEFISIHTPTRGWLLRRRTTDTG